MSASRSAPRRRWRSGRSGSRTAQMTLEALLIVLMAGTEVFRPLRDLRTVLHQGMVGQSAAAGIHALLAAEPLVPLAATAAISPRRPAGCRRPRLLGCRPPSRSRTCASPIPAGGGPAHDGLSFAVAAGETIGIVGPSGSGKSSIVRLLLRLFDPQRGAVRIGGHDLRSARPRGAAPADRGRAPGHLPVPRHGRGEPAPRQARRDRRPSSRPPRAPPTRTTSSRRCRRATRR